MDIVIAFSAMYSAAQSSFNFYVASKASADNAGAAVRDTEAI
jgi:hypothetical protein